jgi:tetratricopeptide (TPR) repeat protein
MQRKPNLPVLMAAATALASALLAQGPVSAAPGEPQRGSGSEQRGPNADLRYFDLSLGDALYAALVEDDMDFVLSAMSGVAASSGMEDTGAFTTAIRAMADGKPAEAAAALAEHGDGSASSAGLLMLARLAAGDLPGATRGWEAFRTNPAAGPFYRPWRGFLAERAGQGSAALALWEEADTEGEMLFNPTIARRYFVLLARERGKEAAIARIDDIFGSPDLLDDETRALRQAILDNRASAPALSERQLAGRLLGDLVSLSQLARTFGDPRTRGRTDPDAVFVGEGLLLRSALLLSPDDVGLRTQTSSLLSDFDEKVAARAVLQDLEATSTSATVLTQLSDLSFDVGRVRDAIMLLQRVPEADRDAWWMIQLSYAHAIQGKREEALAEARAAVEQARRGGNPRVLRAVELSYAGVLRLTGADKAQVAELARSVMAAASPDERVRGAAAMLLMRTDPSADAEAIPVARAGLDVPGAEHGYRSDLGDLLMDRPEHRDEGLGLLRGALELRPRSPLLMNALGYSLVDHRVDIVEGFRLLERAHDLRPDDPNITDSLGWAYYKLGHLDEALVLVERSASMFEEMPNPEVLDHLGDIYWHLGRRDDARAQWQRALDLGLGYTNADKLPGKIADGLAGPSPQRQPLPVTADPGSI